jgi:type VI secretion system protein ImpC
MRIALLGDWSGRAHRAAPPAPSRLADCRPVLIDRDNFDQVLAKLAPHIEVPVTPDGSTRISIHFSQLDDFHPDRLFERLEAFGALRKLRASLSDPSTFPAAAAQIRQWYAAAEPAPLPPPPSAPPPAQNPAGLLEQILGGPPLSEEAAPRTSREAGWQAVLQRIVEPYLLPRVDYAQQAQLLAVVDQAIAGHMRALLHHPHFQAAEAAWRALHFLVRRLDTDTDLKLYLLDVTRDELAADLGASEDLRSSGTYRLLVEQSVGTAGGQPWGVLLGHYTFDAGVEDVELLGRLARIAQQAGAPFLAAASPRVLGCASLAQTPDPDDWLPGQDSGAEQAWQALRHLPEAGHLGLALPRFLLRSPYGKDADPVEQFAFEEMAGGSFHENYLWGNPAVACVYLLGRAFNHSGWDFHPGALQEIEGLPLHVFAQDGDRQMQPCAEAWLTDRAAEAILRQGLMPLVSVRGRDAVRLPGFLSVASPAQLLAGRWGHE